MRQGLGQVKMIARLAGAGLLVMSAGCGPRGTSAGEGVSGAYMVLPAIPGRPGTLYFVIDATASDPAVGERRRLMGVEVEGVARAEMHETMTMAGMTSMAPMTEVPLPDGIHRFCPGGRHVMLFGIDPALKAGATAQVRLRLDGGRTLNPRALVLALGERPRADTPNDCR